MKKRNSAKNIIPIALVVLAVLIIFYYVGFFSFIVNLFHEPALTPDIACGNGFCEYAYEDVSTCAQDCKPLRTLKSSEINSPFIGAGLFQRYTFIGWIAGGSRLIKPNLPPTNKNSVDYFKKIFGEYLYPIGIGFARVEFDWAKLEWPNSRVNPGGQYWGVQRSFEWNYTDIMISELSARNINIEAMLYQQRQNPFDDCRSEFDSLLVNNSNGGGNLSYGETYRDAWLRFVNASVTRYKDNITDWQVGLEYYNYPACDMLFFNNGSLPTGIIWTNWSEKHNNPRDRCNEIDKCNEINNSHTKKHIGWLVNIQNVPGPDSAGEKTGIVKNNNGKIIGDFNRYNGLNKNEFAIFVKNTSKMIRAIDDNSRIILGEVGPETGGRTLQIMFDDTNPNYNLSHYIDAVKVHWGGPTGTYTPEKPEAIQIKNFSNPDQILTISDYENQIGYYNGLLKYYGTKYRRNITLIPAWLPGGDSSTCSGTNSGSTGLKYFLRYSIMTIETGNKEVLFLLLGDAIDMYLPNGNPLGDNENTIVDGFQRLASVFNNETEKDSSINAYLVNYPDVIDSEEIKNIPFSKNNKNFVSYWFAASCADSRISDELTTSVTINKILKNPILIDMFTGEVWNLTTRDYSISGNAMTFTNMPLRDYPMIIADMGAVYNVPDEPEIICGDGVCDASESCSRCSKDCGSCFHKPRSTNNSANIESSNTTYNITEVNFAGNVTYPKQTTSATDAIVCKIEHPFNDLNYALCYYDRTGEYPPGISLEDIDKINRVSLPEE